jgi:hypothetical protein
MAVCTNREAEVSIVVHDESFGADDHPSIPDACIPSDFTQYIRNIGGLYFHNPMRRSLDE